MGFTFSYAAGITQVFRGQNSRLWVLNEAIKMGYPPAKSWNLDQSVT